MLASTAASSCARPQTKAVNTPHGSLPHLGTDLVATLASLDVDNLTHGCLLPISKASRSVWWGDCFLCTGCGPLLSPARLLIVFRRSLHGVSEPRIASRARAPAWSCRVRSLGSWIVPAHRPHRICTDPSGEALKPAPAQYEPRVQMLLFCSFFVFLFCSPPCSLWFCGILGRAGGKAPSNVDLVMSVCECVHSPYNPKAVTHS